MRSEKFASANWKGLVMQFRSGGVPFFDFFPNYETSSINWGEIYMQNIIDKHIVLIKY